MSPRLKAGIINGLVFTFAFVWLPIIVGLHLAAR